MPGSRRALAALTLALLAVAPPAWAYGRLDLTAHPKSARVWVDGAPAGGVPTTIDLTEGPHKVKVSAPGWHPHEFGVKVTNGHSTRRSLSLAPYGRSRRSGMNHGHSTYAASRSVARPQTVVRKLRPAPKTWAPVAARHAHNAPVIAAVPARHASVEARPPLVLAPIDQPITGQDLPLPAPALAPPAPDAPSPLAPPPAPTPVVPAPPEPGAVMPAVTPEKTWLGLDARSWGDLGWLTLMGAIVGGLIGLLSQRLQGPGTWHARRPPRGVIPPASEADEAPADAWAALATGNWEVATRALWHARPASAWVYYHLGLAYEQLGHDLEAEAAYRTAMAADPTFAAAGYNLGVMLDRLGQAPQAAIAYRRLLEACPADADALFNLGHLYRELGLPQQAEVHWTAAKQISPRDATLSENLRMLRRERRNGFSWPSRQAAQAPRPA